MNLGDMLPAPRPFPYRPPTPPNLLDEIYPNLWLGSLRAAESAEILQAHGITDVISITSHRPKIPHGLLIRKKHFRLRDNTTADLLSILPECIDMIEQVMTGGTDENGRERKLLVHCRMGISRSGGMVVAYAMKSAMMPASMALEYVRSRRPIVCPNRAFMAQLTVWGECGYDTALLMPDIDPQVEATEQVNEEGDEDHMLQMALEMSLRGAGTGTTDAGDTEMNLSQGTVISSPTRSGLVITNPDRVPSAPSLMGGNISEPVEKMVVEGAPVQGGTDGALPPGLRALELVIQPGTTSTFVLDPAGILIPVITPTLRLEPRHPESSPVDCADITMSDATSTAGGLTSTSTRSDSELSAPGFAGGEIAEVVDEMMIEDTPVEAGTPNVLPSKPQTPELLSRPDTASTSVVNPASIPIPTTPPNLYPEKRHHSPFQDWVDVTMGDAMKRRFEECIRDVNKTYGLGVYAPSR